MSTPNKEKITEVEYNLKTAINLNNDHKPNDAINFFEKAFDIMDKEKFRFEDKIMSDAYRGLGDCYTLTKQNNYAIESYRKSLGCRWSLIVAHNLFSTLVEEKRYDDAFRFWKEGEERNGFPYFTFRVLGQLFESIGEFQKAIDIFDQYIIMNKEKSQDKSFVDSDTMNRKGKCLEKLGKIKEANYCYDEAKKMKKLEDNIKWD